MLDSLALIVILSFFIPFLSVRFLGGLIPSVAIEIIIGIIIGVNGFNLINTNSEVMEFLSTFGLIYLMFLGGLESSFDLKSLRSKDFIHSPVFIGFVVFILTLALSYAFSVFLISTFHCATSAAYLTLVFSTTSVAIVFPTLKSRGDIKSSYKQALIMSALTADFATLFMITVFSLLMENKNNIADALVMLFIIVFAFMVKAGVKFFTKFKWINKTVSMMKHKPHIQMGIRGSLAVLFIFLLLAEKLGIEIILGSFIAGILISKISRVESEVLSLKLDAMGYGFFIPFFFIYQGAKSRLPIFSGEGVALLLVILIGSFLIKMLSALPFRLRFSTKETIAAGVLLSGRLSLIIAASIIGVKLGIIDKQMNSAIILLAAFSCVISPAAFGLINKKRFQKGASRIIIIGGGKVGSSIAERLSEKQKSVIVIEKDPDECSKLKKRCLAEIYCTDALDIKLWETIKPTGRDKVLLVTDSDEINIKAANILQDNFGVYKIFARDNDPQNRELFKKNGIVPLVYTEALIKTIENAIENPTTFELLSGSDKIISEKTINKLSNSTIKQSGLSSIFEIILIKRDNKWLKPFDDFVLKKGDTLVFVVDKKDESSLNSIEL